MAQLEGKVEQGRQVRVGVQGTRIAQTLVVTGGL
jgi:hypothetical protein